jgi:hypothetical protein
VKPLWVAQREVVRPGFSEKIVIAKGERALTFTEVIAGWRDDAVFRAFTCATLAAAPYPAYFWEMPPIRRGHLDVPYECMLIRSDALARLAPDADAFAAQFKTAGNVVATFPNLGGDAVLVAPEQIAGAASYAHLAAFVRTTPQAQQQQLFQALGDAIDGFSREYNRQIWISTSGLGIAWLHIRLDTVPKYYQHWPYARM